MPVSIVFGISGSNRRRSLRFLLALLDAVARVPGDDDVHVLGEALDQAVALREARATFEGELATELVGQHPERLRDPIVLLDELRV
jgi:hypothetical protein